MAKKKRQRKKEEEFVALDELMLSLSKRLDKIPVGKGQATAIKWGIIAAVLIAASSVLFYLGVNGTIPWMGSWIPALIGAPAGIILYVIGLGIIQRTKAGEWEIFHMRENYSFKQRLKRIAVWFGVYALIFIPSGKYIPYGLGGAILIVLVMTAITTGRRTPAEILLAKKGLPDPRDLEALDDLDDYAEEEELPMEDTPEADTIYYDEQRGGFGGKLK
jgi:hypothetical protein